LQVKQQLEELQVAADTAHGLQQQNHDLQAQLSAQGQASETAQQQAGNACRSLQQQLAEANQRYNQQVQQHK
jgi:hypothetical protein